MREALRHFLLENQMSYSSHASYTSHFAIGKARSTTKWVCVLRVVEHLPLLFSIQLSKINLAHSSATFQVRKHTFKASVACNGPEVLHGTPNAP